MNPYVIPGLKGDKVPPSYFVAKSGLSPHDIIECVCSVMDVRPELIVHKTRKRNVVEARHIIGFLLVKKAGLSYSHVGKNIMGGRDHTTILNNVEKFNNFYETDEIFRNKTDLIIEKLISWTPRENRL